MRGVQSPWSSLRRSVKRRSRRGWNPFRNKQIIPVLGAGVALVALIGGGVYAQLGGVGQAANSSTDINLQKGLVGYWNFNGNAKDATPYADNGTVTSATLTTDRKGKASSAYSFNGSSKYITYGSGSPLNMTGDMTISVWVNATNDSNYDPIISKGSVGEYELAADFRSGSTSLAWRSTNGSVNVPSFFSGYTGTWVHITAVVTGTNLQFYRNGQAFGSVQAIGTRSTSATALTIGRRTSQSFWWNGSIDDVRLYNRALNTNEVTALFNEYDSGVALAGGESGLLGWWKLNGNGKDSTPYSNTVSTGNVTPTTDRKGASNSAYSFNGTTSCLYNSTITNAMNTIAAGTLSAWIYPTATTASQTIVRVGANSDERLSLYLDGSNKRLYIEVYSGGTWPKVYGTNNSVTLNAWSHVAVTVNGSNGVTFYVNGVSAGTGTLSSGPTATATSFVIGSAPCGGGQQFGGSISDVRVYNRVLSASELTAQAQSYNSQTAIGGSPQSSINLGKGLVGYWPMNGNAKDATPYSDNGTVTNATLTTDRKGRSNSAYSFSGNGVIVTTNNNILSITGGLTLSVWVNITNDGTYQPIITKNANEYEMAADFRSGATNLQISQNNNTTNAKVTGFFTGYTGVWIHIAIVTDGTHTYFYRNGSLVQTSGYNTPSVGTDKVALGSRGTGSSYHLNGSMDDVRIWNRALSGSEIAVLYNEYQ